MQTSIRRRALWGAAAFALAALVALFAAQPPQVAAQEETNMGRTITVSGMGTASGTPDTVYLGVGVDRVDANIDNAVNGARDALRSIIAAVRDSGVEERDIQTAYYNVFPEDRFDPATGQPTGERQYRVSLGINIVVRSVDNATPVISAVLNAGATNINSFSFGIADTRPLESEARLAAVEDARARAAELATAFGVTLGELISVEEGLSGGVPAPLGEVRMASMGGNNQVVPGSLSINVGLSVTFAISG